jgi:hypothetical protein
VVVDEGGLHPEFTVYVIVAVPGPVAVTFPELSTEIEVLSDDHVPPASPVLDKNRLLPTQYVGLVLPVIVPAVAFGLTVIAWKALAGLLQPPVIV